MVYGRYANGCLNYGDHVDGCLNYGDHSDGWYVPKCTNAESLTKASSRPQHNTKPPDGFMISVLVFFLAATNASTLTAAATTPEVDVVSSRQPAAGK